MTLSDAWRRGQHGWPASYPLVQAPNAPLLVAFSGWLVAAATDGSAHGYGRAVFYAGVAAWAWEEITGGANLVRRAAGVGGFVYIVAQVGESLAT